MRDALLGIVFVPVIVLGWGLGVASAQSWTPYESVQDGFRINFPGVPEVTETTWESQLGYVLPARVYEVRRGAERYAVTVVDYSGLEALGLARAAECPPGNAQCRENAGPVLGAGYWKHDERGAIVYATARLLSGEGVSVTGFAWEWQDRVEGHALNLANVTAGTKTSAFVGMHEHRLYVAEGTVPEHRPEPGLFQQSLGWIDAEGRGIRYDGVYSNSFHAIDGHPKPGLVGR